jgi:L-sorbose 1-phosphate reductase
MIPKTQYAIQLVGPEKLVLNKSKDVPQPGPKQVLLKIESVGLCFSDLKLLKQFSAHARKGEIVKGITKEALGEISSYVPGDAPTVPGHEAVGRIVAVGAEVKRHQVGERCLVQTDYRELPTNGSCAAFGYNFEGGLQEYVLMDERVIIDPVSNERFLIPVGGELSASAIALAEPWACVEDSYVNVERRTIKEGGRLLVVAASDHKVAGVVESFSPQGNPSEISIIGDGDFSELESHGVALTVEENIASLADESYDDIVYFGSNKDTIESLNDKLAVRGIINIVTCGETIGELVSIGVGRVHYGMTRWIGTASDNAADSYSIIPSTGEIRQGDSILVMGAGGPMGQMHVIRNVCSGLDNVSVVGTEVEDARLALISEKVAPMAKANGVNWRSVNALREPLNEEFSYIVIMVPMGEFVVEAIAKSMNSAMINVFAGIPAPVRHELDMDAYIAKRCYMFGTSGSTIEDMKIILEKVNDGRLDTNSLVDAVSGMAGAAEGIAAVQNRTLAGKIMVYPKLHELGLIPLADMKNHYPSVASKLENGRWCKAAEDELLAVAGK